MYYASRPPPLVPLWQLEDEHEPLFSGGQLDDFDMLSQPLTPSTAPAATLAPPPSASWWFETDSPGSATTASEPSSAREPGGNDFLVGPSSARGPGEDDFLIGPLPPLDMAPAEQYSPLPAPPSPAVAQRKRARPHDGHEHASKRHERADQLPPPGPPVRLAVALPAVVPLGPRRLSNDPVAVRRRNDRRHACPEPNCTRRFVNRLDLERHMRTHTGERPYQCTVCHKFFRQTGTLRVHMRIHEGVKPYPCVQCGRSFRHRNVCVEHQRRCVEKANAAAQLRPADDHS